MCIRDRVISFEETEEDVREIVIVKNTGDTAGKQVVQVYAEAPQGKLGKAARSLCAFKKTAVLEPGASEEMEIVIPKAKLASYDDSGVTGHKSAYVLEEMCIRDSRYAAGTGFLLAFRNTGCSRLPLCHSERLPTHLPVSAFQGE